MKLHLSIIVFITVIISSAADSLKTLAASVGGNITLPDAVEERGILSYEGKDLVVIYADVPQMLDGNYKQRLHWNKTTGCFTLSKLQKSDSGMYTVLLKKGQDVCTEYQLIVYEPLLAPAVHTMNVNSGSCSLLCLVDGSEDVTLLWYKDQEVVKRRGSAGPLRLTVPGSDYGSSYRCVASNPAEHRTLVVDVEAACSPPKLRDETGSRSWLFLIPIHLCWSFIVFWIILTNLKHKKEKEAGSPSHLR